MVIQILNFRMGAFSLRVERRASDWKVRMGNQNENAHCNDRIPSLLLRENRNVCSRVQFSTWNSQIFELDLLRLLMVIGECLFISTEAER